MVDKGYVEAYTRWITSETTKEVLLMAQSVLINQAHAIEDDSLVGAAKAHWFRRGGEVMLNFLTTQMTVEQLEKAQTQDDPDPDYGAEEIINNDLFKKG